MEIPAEVERLAREGRTAMAVKRLCDLTGVSLSEARRLVTDLEGGGPGGRSRNGSRRSRVGSRQRYGWLAFLGILIGTILTGRTVYQIYMSLETSGWERTEGVIVQSDLRRARRSETITYDFIVRFEYEVGERQYTGNRVGYAPQVYSESRVRRAARRYGVGRRVDVYYDPGDPARAVLVKGGSVEMYPILVIGLFFLSLGFWGIRKFKERQMPLS